MIKDTFFLTGIGTDIGKTVSAAVLCKALGYGYWKPIQSGSLEFTDSKTVHHLVGEQVPILEEVYRFKAPLSPDIAARKEGIKIDLQKIITSYKKINSPVIIEGAGGVLVPLNEKNLLIDLIKLLGVSVILVSSHYVGSINHTLLTIEALQQREIVIKGIIFSGDDPGDNEGAILSRYNIPLIARFPKVDQVGRKEIELWAKKVNL